MDISSRHKLKLLWQQIPNPLITEIMCNSIMDGVVLDKEHGCFNDETIYNCIQIIRLKHKKCFVRVKKNIDETFIGMCLDAGCTGFIIANVKNFEEYYRIKDMCDYRSTGLYRSNKWDVNNPKPDITLVAQIESHISELEKLVKMTKADYYLIGPYDLSASLGIAGDFTNDVYLCALKHINVCIPHNKLGLHLVRDWDWWEDNDYGFMAYGLDSTMLIDSLRNIEQTIYHNEE